MNKALLRWAPVCLAAAVPLGAQATTHRVLPAVAEAADGHEATPWPFGRTAFRTQQVFDGAFLVTTSATLTELAWRPDRGSLPLPAATLPNVTIELSHTAFGPGSLAPQFAANRTSQATEVFRGRIDLPGVAPIETGTAPWLRVPLTTPFTYRIAQGSLLVEVAGRDPQGAPTGWELDAAVGGGAATPFGNSGSLASDVLGFVAHTGLDLDPMRIVLGGQLDLSVTTSFGTYPGITMVGFDDSAFGGHPLPLDLGPFGAPQNQLYVAPVADAPLVFQQTFIGFTATVSLGIPFDPALVGLELYAQGALLDPQANQAGLVTTHGLEAVIGPASEAATEMLVSTDPDAARGTLLRFPGDLRGGAVMRFSGTLQ